MNLNESYLKLINDTLNIILYFGNDMIFIIFSILGNLEY